MLFQLLPSFAPAGFAQVTTGDKQETEKTTTDTDLLACLEPPADVLTPKALSDWADKAVTVRTRPSRVSNVSLCSLPHMPAPAKPLPISKPCTQNVFEVDAPAQSACRQPDMVKPRHT